MVPINTSIDDTEASNAGSGTGTGTGIGMGAGSRFRTAVGAGTGAESEMGTGAGTVAGSLRRIVAERSLNDHIADVTIDIGDQLNISGEGGPENELTMFVRITSMLETTASGLGKLEIVWMMAVLQGGFAFTLQMKDFVFITVTLLFGGIRIFCGSPKHNMQQLALFYWFQLVSAMTTSVLSAMQLYSQDFGQTEKTFKENWDFTLIFFYVVALAEALVLLAWCYLLRRPFGN